MDENQNGTSTSQSWLSEEAKEYFEKHPQLADQFRRAEKVYRIFGEYLSLTQPRTIIRETGGSNTEVDLNATLSRANT
jgi:hypothetical protein